MKIGRRAVLRFVPALAAAALVATAVIHAQVGPSGNAEIRRPFDGSDIVLRTSSRVAGAIDSLTWRGTEFINSYDHGRELQSAASFNRHGECFNPTEAGSRDDGKGATSSSTLVSLKVEGARLRTRTRMAFWLAPGQQCRPGVAAANDRILSDHELDKVVTLGARGIPNVIEHDVTYRVPAAYDVAIFEALTAYMPPSFSQFWSYDPREDRLAPLSDGPGEQRLPVIMAKPAGDFALGVYSAGSPDPRARGAGFGRWRFAHLEGQGNATVKWNCTFRMRMIAAGNYPFTCYSIIGSLAQVKEAMHKLAQAVPMQPPPDRRRR
jgi:hypothetical protein